MASGFSPRPKHSLERDFYLSGNLAMLCPYRYAMFSSELLDVIHRSQNSLHRVNFASGIVFMALGLAAIAGSFFVTTTNGLKGFLWLVGLGAIAAGLANCIYYQLRCVDIAEVLTHDPQQVVWVYRRVNTGRVSGVQVAQFNFIVFGFRSKRQVPVRLPSHAVDFLMQQLPKALPHVTVGYSPEYAKAFRQNPDALAS